VVFNTKLKDLPTLAKKLGWSVSTLLRDKLQIKLWHCVGEYDDFKLVASIIIEPHAFRQGGTILTILQAVVSINGGGIYMTDWLYPKKNMCYNEFVEHYGGLPSTEQVAKELRDVVESDIHPQSKIMKYYLDLSDEHS